LNFLNNSFKNTFSVKDILEIGSYERRSALFFFDNFKDSNMHCVDTWSGSDEHDNFDFNMMKKTLILTIQYFNPIIV